MKRKHLSQSTFGVHTPVYRLNRSAQVFTFTPGAHNPPTQSGWQRPTLPRRPRCTMGSGAEWVGARGILYPPQTALCPGPEAGLLLPLGLHGTSFSVPSSRPFINAQNKLPLLTARDRGLEILPLFFFLSLSSHSDPYTVGGAMWLFYLYPRCTHVSTLG